MSASPVARKRRSPIIVAYVLSLAVTIALLVVWVVYIVRSVARVREVAGRVGVEGEHIHWIVLTVGCALFFLLIGGLTWQLAQALATRRYALKQEEFVSTVTHELKTPLAAIKLHGQTLATPVSPEQHRRSLERVLQQVERMESLVDDVLETSRLLARKQPLALTQVSVRAFFTGYLTETAPRIDAQGVTLSWEVASAARVMATTDALERVMNNLLDNAARFSRKGGEVRCTVADQDGRVRIEVADDGVGIPRKELKRIFDRFYQAGNARDGRAPRHRARALIVAGLVREMKGHVEAFSPEGRPGAIFVVELPASAGGA